MNELIIGVDPGLHCGFAVLDGDSFECYEFRGLEAADRLYAILMEINKPIATKKPARVSCERYNITGKAAKTNQTDALEVIGAMKWMCKRLHVPFALVGSSDATRGMDRTTLKTLGFWLPGKPDHYQRAAAQVAYTLKTTHPSEYLRRLGS